MWILGWVIVTLPLGGCLVFWDTVNKPPVVQVMGPGQLHRGEQQAFSATVDDDTKGARRYDWWEGPECPPNLMAAQTSGHHVGEAQTAHAGPSPIEMGGYCVWLVVTDADGAKGFSTHPVTVQERTLILEGPTSVTSGQPVTFTASYKEEKDGIARSSLSWARAEDCSSAANVAAAGPPKPGLVMYRYDRASRRPFCVAAVAHDEFSVDHPATLMVTQPQITVAGPPADIHLVQPTRAATITSEPTLGLYTDVRLAAADAGDLDGDETLGFAWKLIRPDGKGFIPTACADARPPGSEVCFQTDMRGRYQAQVTVTDGAMNASAPPFAINVEDQPPCIRDTEPLFASAPKFFEYYDRARIFRVRAVDDDGDPLPAPARASQRAFRWSIRKQGAMPATFQRRVSATFSDFTVPAREYQPGDRIDVRLEYWDRLDLENPAARDFGSRCDPEAPTCELVPGSGCYQWITWTVEYL